MIDESSIYFYAVPYANDTWRNEGVLNLDDFIIPCYVEMSP